MRKDIIYNDNVIMLTNEDIKKLKEVMATKEDLAKLLTSDEFDEFRKDTQEEFNVLRESIQTLTVSVDKTG
ncbi:MAG: hypothetical protein QME57_04765 [Patescibacteria group bacterium]|nr:hypothetical protein [Patescibacteria group bacterium]